MVNNLIYVQNLFLDGIFPDHPSSLGFIPKIMLTSEAMLTMHSFSVDTLFIESHLETVIATTMCRCNCAPVWRHRVSQTEKDLADISYYRPVLGLNSTEASFTE